MKRNIILIIFLFIGEQIYSQNDQYNFQPQEVGASPGQYLLPLMSGYGNSGLLNDVSNIGAVNPAAIQNFNKAFGLSYQFNSRFQDPLVSVYHERINQNIPQSIGIAFPISCFEIGLSMHQKFNTSFAFSDQLKFSNYPDAPEYTVYMDYNRVLFNYSISVSYTLPDFIKNSFFTIGIRYGLNNYMFHQTINSAHLNESFYKSDYVIGTVYTLRKEDNDYFQLGLYYESKLSFSKTSQWNGDLQSMFVGTTPPQFINPNIKLNADFPPTLRFDFDISPSNNIKFLGSISDVYWSTIDVLMKNQMEYSGSAEYLFNKLISASAGFNYIERKYSENSNEFIPFLNELFITAGILIRYGNINLHLAIADGQLIKNKSIEQTIFNSNISYNF